MTEERRINIPESVFLDRRLTPHARLLYGDIAALCYKEGYCWASNAYFAERHGVSKVSVSKWVKQLIVTGYIHSEIQYKNGSDEIEKRILTLAQPVKLNTPQTKVNDPIKDTFNTPIKEKFKDNNTTIFNNTTNNTNDITAPASSSVIKYINSQLYENPTKMQQARLNDLIELIKEPEIAIECINITAERCPDKPMIYLFSLLENAIANNFTLDDVKRDYESYKRH